MVSTFFLSYFGITFHMQSGLCHLPTIPLIAHDSATNYMQPSTGRTTTLLCSTSDQPLTHSIGET